MDFLLTFLEEATEMLEYWEASCLKLEDSNTIENLNDLFRIAHNLKGSSKSVGLTNYSDFVHKLEDLLVKAKDHLLDTSPAFIAILLKSQKVLVDWTEQLFEDPQYCPETSIMIEKILHFKEQSCTSPSFGFFEDSDHNKEKPHPQIQDQTPAPLDHKNHHGHKGNETIRVPLGKLDSIIRLVGELTIQHSIIFAAKKNNSFTSNSIYEAIDLADKIINDLQNEAMSLRMQPLEGLFQRLERVGKDLGRELNKSIKVVVKGESVELDKTVIDLVKDPLIHIIRNAIDHGVEPPEERKSLNKAEKATITIEGIQTPTNVSIIISDDGRGLNRDRIFKKAVQSGLCNEDDEMKDKDIYQLIFHSGLSTAAEVTEVSGRGVGMDVVYNCVSDLGGDIEIDTKPGHGTTMKISLPSTLSVLDAVIISLNGSFYALPLQDIKEIVHLSDFQIYSTTSSHKMINLRDNVVNVMALSHFLPCEEYGSENKDNVAIVAKHSDRIIAFEVDKIAGQQVIFIHDTNEKLTKIPGFSGTTILMSGEPAMIVNLPEIIKSYNLKAA